MTQSPIAAAIAEAIAELDLYDDTDEAEAGRVLLAALNLTDDAEQTLTI